MKKLWVSGGGIIALLAMAALIALGAHAATDKYRFTARGVVTAVDSEDKTITISFTHVTETKAKSDLQGKTRELKAGSAKIFKADSKGKLVRIKVTGVKVGDEVVIKKGAAKSDDTFTIAEAQVNARSFEVVGVLKAHDTTLKTFKILAKTSSYKSQTYKDKEIIMKYSGSTKFTSNGQSRESDEITANEQKVKVSGKIVGNNWEIDTFKDNHSGT